MTITTNGFARNLINAFWYWADNITVARLKQVYGDNADESYLKEKMEKINKNPLRWWTSLDLANQNRLIEICRATSGMDQVEMTGS